MAKLITFFILNLLLAFNVAIAQEKGLKIFNTDKGKEVLIKENKRLKIKMADGSRISGRLRIIDAETIMLNHKTVKLAEIVKLKRNPLLTSSLTKTVFYTAAGIVAFSGIITSVVTGNVAFSVILVPVFAPLVYGGVKPPNFYRNYKSYRKWEYEIVSLQE